MGPSNTAVQELAKKAKFYIKHGRNMLLNLFIHIMQLYLYYSFLVHSMFCKIPYRDIRF